MSLITYWEQIDWMLTWITVEAIATIILAGGVWFAFRQVRQARKSTNAQIAMQLFHELRDEKTIEKLRSIYNLPYDLSTAEGLNRLKNSELKDIDYVTDRFDVLGVLVQKGIVDEDLAIDAYAGTPSLRLWYRLHRHIKKVRSERGYFGANLEDFAARALDYFTRAKPKIKVSFSWMDEEHKKTHKIKDLVTELQNSEFCPKRRNKQGEKDVGG
ncbi:hypothetical protein ACFLVH_06215 [Chloroflexota bacterium]